jgi:predicted nucleic acid-binding protein
MRKRVLLTAKVLHPYALRDILFRLGDVGMIVPYWTPAILTELRQNILAENPDLRRSELDQLIRLMRDIFPDADILEYESELERLPNRLDSRDVVAAALAVRVDAIVTPDRRRFAPELYGYAGIAVLTPDMLLCQCLGEDFELVTQVLNEEGVHKRISFVEVLVALYPQVPQFAERVVKLLLPGTSSEQFEEIMRREKKEQPGFGSNG